MSVPAIIAAPPVFSSTSLKFVISCLGFDHRHLLRPDQPDDEQRHRDPTCQPEGRAAQGRIEPWLQGQDTLAIPGAHIASMKQTSMTARSVLGVLLTASGRLKRIQVTGR
jgi:hypothetical protein